MCQGLRPEPLGRVFVVAPRCTESDVPERRVCGRHGSLPRVGSRKIRDGAAERRAAQPADLRDVIISEGPSVPNDAVPRARAIRRREDVGLLIVGYDRQAVKGGGRPGGEDGRNRSDGRIRPSAEDSPILDRESRQLRRSREHSAPEEGEVPGIQSSSDPPGVISDGGEVATLTEGNDESICHDAESRLDACACGRRLGPDVEKWGDRRDVQKGRGTGGCVPASARRWPRGHFCRPGVSWYRRPVGDFTARGGCRWCPVAPGPLLSPQGHLRSPKPNRLSAPPPTIPRPPPAAPRAGGGPSSPRSRARRGTA